MILPIVTKLPFKWFYPTGEKQEQRTELLQRQAASNQCPIAYVNLVGGQDELVFDGDSMLLDAGGNIVFRAEAFTIKR